MRSKTCLFLILTFVLFIPSIIYSAVVTQTTAEQVALNLYTERNERALSDFKIIETFVEQENANNIYYIFNFDKTGFVIVSADDIAVPILGYVFEHNYTTENHPPQFDAMLASFKEQILYARENDLSPAQETVDKWNRLKVTADIFVPENVRVVLPLLSTTWNQGQYYNESCPADAGSVPSDPNTPGNGYVWAGCTATATAQVMKYHAHPAIGEGTHSYTDATYGLQSANFGATTYSWALMPNNVLAVNPSVHTLLYHVGVGAEMGYGVYGSGAWIGGAHPATALSALQNHFKYDSNSYYDQRNNYTATPLVWHGMLKTELDNNRPLVYDGYNSGGTDGHAFVIDGYQGASNDSYHVNWGWSGGYNGYFTLDALAPSLPNYDYRFFQAALFGVEPRKWRPLPDVSIDVSLLPYTGVDLDNYYEGSTTSLSYSVVTDLSLEEFTLTFNGNNQLIFTANPTVTSNVNIDITIRAAYTGGLADDTFNFIITGASSNYDFGDAPDSYLTLLGSNGARHLIGSYYLGTLI
ncbi:MAG: C10 family peptidase, partial [Candidatus Tenebribacter davisii]|nr:C10 family peptidase [Candidatus Tenebribacter davisii]